ncbi:hypothetical protein ACVK1X_005127 [Pseudomonas sp. PvR086]|jgi:hypothetical protein|uniref:hypothetical protein n=1 Tax=Pseudomonas TaxID=286 RepID=UPI00110E8742|nr:MULTISPECIES: hypothetical protein [Pseudomonas]MBD9608196.1 hypothetical protein [Pseudomonas sp. PDM08]MDR7109780.1 hypothetical protein [Pseudomonas frederiksbergensis]QDV97037.1 hypothetical protein FFH90_023165 [Pseudomonas sp. ATCC 43928]WLG46437.1 hypothetical protein PSH69_07430 [Pseudomonas sp. FP1740]
MQKKCDLYLCGPVDASRLKMLRLFDNDFACEDGKVFSGYLFVSVNRVKLVAVVSALRQKQILCFSVPVEYREGEISFEIAFEIAKKYSAEQGVVVGVRDQSQCPPLFWSFSLSSVGHGEKKAGGMLMVDRLDGHIWGLDEYEEYMYDYNNIF